MSDLGAGQAILNGYRENYDIFIKKFVKTGRLVKLPENQGYQEPRSKYIFPVDITSLSGNEQMVPLLYLQYVDFGIPILTGKKRDARFSAEGYIAAHYPDIRAEAVNGSYKLQSVPYPECFETYPNLRQQERADDAAQKFSKLADRYADVRQAASDRGFLRAERDHKVSLEHELAGISVPLKGNPKQLIAAVEKANAQYDQWQHSSKSASEGALGIEVQPPPVFLDFYLPQGQQDLVHHHKSYHGKLPRLDEQSNVVILDSAALMRLLGNGDDHSKAVGQKVLQSMMSNPHISAIIIPDYIADIEMSGLRVEYHKNGESHAEFLTGRTPGRERYLPAVHHMLKHGIRRHIDEATGKESFLYDPDTRLEDLCPKLIVWETPLGAKLKSEPLNGEAKVKGRGKRQIEDLLSDTTFKPGNALVISSDYNYITDEYQHAPSHTRNVGYANLAQYTKALLIGRLSEWAKATGCVFSQRDKDLPKRVSTVQDAVLNMLRNNAPPDINSNNPFVLCTNPELFEQVTGLATPGQSVTNAQITAAANKGISLQ